jgi:putative LysE/RhtB family amino acid efflux pump
MTLHLFWQGCLVGMLAAVPLGPMGMICVQRTMDRGRWVGLASATGLTTALALWCVIALQGFSAVGSLVAGRELLLRAGLGLFLVAAGLQGLIRTRRAVPENPGLAPGTLVAHFTSSFMGVVLNPVTFVTLTAVLAVLNVVRTPISPPAVIGLSAAVFVGGMAMWTLLTHGLTRMRHHLGESACGRISLGLNICILLLGLGYLASPWV